MEIPIIDTHQHMLMTESWPYSWTQGLEKLDKIRFGYEEYLKETEGAGVTTTLFMEATPDDPLWVEEIKHVLEMAADPSTIINGAIANCRPEEQGFDAWIDELRGPYLKGLRRILHVVPDDVSTSSLFRENVNKLGSMNLTFDLCFFERQLPIAIELADACPNTPLILDHCGVPDIAGGDMTQWKIDLKEISKRDHMHCKISGLLAYCSPDNANIDAVRPYVEYAIECFGWDRVIWGGDWPLCQLTSSLNNWVSISRELVASEDEANQHKLFHGNAERVYNTPLLG